MQAQDFDRHFPISFGYVKERALFRKELSKVAFYSVPPFLIFVPPFFDFRAALFLFLPIYVFIITQGPLFENLQCSFFSIPFFTGEVE